MSRPNCSTPTRAAPAARCRVRRRAASSRSRLPWPRWQRSPWPRCPPARARRIVPPVAPGRTTVAVLNGSGRPGAAGRVATELADRGWTIGTVDNYTDRSLETSCVDFVPGRSAAASRIAKEIGIYNVLPATRLMTELAGPKAGVIVIVGADQAR
ncbi:MAG: LytR family transcriptional regulator [Actinobacteria bacterium]|nr:MAG: LytR family transcriptional regulator [Actinomycetota bacterium]